MYALGLGERVIGVTAFARYPEEVKKTARIGGYSDINIEAVYALKPDLVLALEQQDSSTRQLRALGLHIAEFNSETIEDILDQIQRIGTLLQRSEKAKELCRSIQKECQILEQAAETQPRHRVLISVGRNMGTGEIGDVYAAGQNTLFGQIIELAGGENVYQGKAPYAALGKEALLRLNPEIIIDLIPDMDKMIDFTKAEARKQWDKIPEIAAVRNNRITINMASYICIPGPRITLMIRDIAAAIHPDLYGSPAP